MQDNVKERCQRLKSSSIDLLQFHWQFVSQIRVFEVCHLIGEQYDDPQYIEALHFLQEDPRIKLLGLCNFDTQRMQEILDAGINIVTNQVQVSRPCCISVSPTNLCSFP